MSMHMLASAALGVAELRLSQDEAKQLGEASANVLRHFPNVQIAQKTMDISNLVAAGILIYGTRIGAYAARKRNERTPQRPHVVTPFPGKNQSTDVRAHIVPDGPG